MPTAPASHPHERHLRRLRKEYGERRRVLVQALEKELAGLVQYSQEEAGLHVMLLLDPDLDEETIVGKATAAGVGVYPGNAYHVGAPERPSILLGYSGLRRAEIEQGVARLAAVLRSMAAGS